MKKLVLLFLFSCFVSVFANDKVFDVANTYYKDGQYTEAIAVYEDLIKGDQVSSELYYNLGNCYYKLNKVAPAIFNYEKALQLNPANEDAKNNLIFANRLTIDRIEALPKSVFQKLDENYLSKITLNTWGVLAIVFAFVAVAMFLLFYFTYSSSKKRLFFTFSLLSLLLLLLSFGIGFQQYQKEIKTKEAIVFAEQVSVQSEPTNNSSEAFELHEGTKVLVLDAVDNWNKIKLADGKIGWLKKSTIKLLNTY